MGDYVTIMARNWPCGGRYTLLQYLAFDTQPPRKSPVIARPY